MKSWNFEPYSDWDMVRGQLLQDIREELITTNALLRSMNSILTCPNATAIPDLLRRIEKNTTKRKRRKKVAL